jgi:PAS domain S-box-containing protein
VTPSDLDVDAAMLGALVREVPDAVVLIDQIGTIQYANPALEVVLGYAPEDLVGRNYEVLVPEHLRVAHAAHHMRFAARPTARPMGASLPLRARRRDGSLVPVEVSLVPLRGSELVAAFVRDTSDRQRLVERLAATNQVSTEILANGDHRYVRHLTTRLARLLLDADAAVHLSEPEETGPEADPTLVDPPDVAPGALIAAFDEVGGWDAIRSGPAILPATADREAASGPFLAVPVRTSEHRYGALAVWRAEGRRGFDGDDREALVQFADSCAVSIELARARGELERMAVLEDHDRIARDLHDMVIQRVFAVALHLEAASAQLQPSAVGPIRDAVTSLDQVIRDLRSSIFGLRNGTDLRSLRARLEAEVQVARRGLGYPPQLRVSGPVDTIVVDGLADDAVAVVREALANVVRHSGASEVEVSVAVDDERLSLRVTDDGIGPPDGPGRGDGLRNIVARASRRGGCAGLGPAPGGGAVLEWSVPLA